MPNDSYQKRKTLFDKFSGQLHLMKNHGLLNINLKYDKTYICPICLEQFTERHLIQSGDNYLTLEDAPPDSLKGSKIALTCRKCNNGCGQTIDFHLTEIIRQIDASYFYKDSVHHRKILFEGKPVNVELTSMGDGTLQAYHRIKTNNPNLLDKFIYALKEKTLGPLLNLEPAYSRVDNKRVNYALVKTTYIIIFAKFGYIFLLDPAYEPIRQQLLHPDQVIYPWTPFIKDQFTNAQVCTYYVHNPGLKSIFNIFSLRTEYSETLIGGLLPVPGITTEEFGKRIDATKDHEYHVVLDTTHYDPDAQIFSNMTELQKVRNWAYKL